MPDDTGEDQQKSDSQQPEKTLIPLKLYLHGNCGDADKVWYVGRYEEQISERTDAEYIREFDVTFLPNTAVTDLGFCFTVHDEATGAVVPSSAVVNPKPTNTESDAKSICSIKVSKPQSSNWPQAVVFTITVAVDRNPGDQPGPESEAK